MEHISEEFDDILLENLVSSLTSTGICIVGMPSMESQKYASEGSLQGHVNCKSGEALRNLFLRYFHNVFVFSMNDEVVHTGYFPMAHYLICIGVSPKKIDL